MTYPLRSAFGRPVFFVSRPFLLPLIFWLILLPDPGWNADANSGHIIIFHQTSSFLSGRKQTCEITKDLKPDSSEIAPGTGMFKYDEGCHQNSPFFADFLWTPARISVPEVLPLPLGYYCSKPSHVRSGFELVPEGRNIGSNKNRPSLQRLRSATFRAFCYAPTAL